MLPVAKRIAEVSRSRCLQIPLRTSRKCLDTLFPPTKRGKLRNLPLWIRQAHNPRTMRLLRRVCASIGTISLLLLLYSFWWERIDRPVYNSSCSFPDEIVEEGQCEGRRVFMYDLPREFNLGVLERCFGQMVYWLNFCPHTLNNGFGQLLDFVAVPSNSSLFSQFFARRVSSGSTPRTHSSSSDVWDSRSIQKFILEEADSRRSCVIHKGGSWFATDAYMLEEIYHKRMLHYPCLTADPALASAFFLPYYAGLEALEYLYGAKRAQPQEHGRGLVQFLEEHPSLRPYWKRNGGHDHFMVAGRTGWDFNRGPDDESGWGTGIFRHQELQNVTFLVLEGRGWRPEFEQAVPYPTSFHPPLVKKRGTQQCGQDDGANLGNLELEEWIRKVQHSRRDSLFAFVGAQRPNLEESIRGLLYEQCLQANTNNEQRSRLMSSASTSDREYDDAGGSSKRTSPVPLSEREFHPVCASLDCSNIKCGHNPQPAIDTFLHSEFCLQPRGDTATRRSTFDSIVAGCIPVFFHTDSAYTQYKWHLPADPESYSVYVPEEDIRQGKSVEHILRVYSEEQVQRLRATLLSLLPRVMYMDFVESPGTISASRCDTKAKHLDEPSNLDRQPREPMLDAFDLAVQGMLQKVAAFHSIHAPV